MVGVNGDVFFSCTDGNLYCLIGASGSERWLTPVGSALNSAPALSVDGYVYVGTDSGQLFCLDQATGLIVWQSFISGDGPQPLGPPAIGADGTIYVECDDGYFYAVNNQTGAVNWSYNLGLTGFTNAALSCPAIDANGVIYLGGSGSVIALTSTGTLKWSYSAPQTSSGAADVFSSVALGPDGKVYAIFGLPQVAGANLYALDGTTGAFLWEYPGLGLPNECPTVGPDSTVYLNNSDGYVYAIDGETGHGIWYYKNQADALTSVALASDGTVYSLSTNGSLYAINGTTGKVLWSSQALSDGFSDPAIAADGSLYVSGFEGQLFAFASNLIPASLTLNPGTLVGGNISTATLTMSRPVPSPGIYVPITSNNAGVTVPASVFLPTGETSITFPVTTVPVLNQLIVSISAAYNAITVSAPLTINPPTFTGFTLTPTSVVGGQSATGTVTISSSAPAGGFTINLSETGNAASVPNYVTIPEGQTSATFTVTTVQILTASSATITASLAPVSFSQNLSIGATLAPVNLTFNPATVVGSAPSTGTVTLNYAAPTGGAVVALQANQSGVIVPGTVTVPAGKTAVSFPVSTPEVVAPFVVTVTATLNGYQKSGTLTLDPFSIVGIALAPSTVVGGVSSTATVTLNGQAPSGGLIITLASSNPSISVPGSITVPAGQNSVSFSIPTVAVTAQTMVTVTAKLNGVSPQSATLTINPSALLSVTLNPNAVAGGNSSIGTITLTGIAPNQGYSASLTTTSTAISIPSSVLISPGNSSATFKVKTAIVTAPVSATINVALNGLSQTVSITVNPSTIMSIAVNPSTLLGGASSAGLVTLTGPAPKAGVKVILSSSSKSATVVSSVMVPAQKTTATFTVKTVAVGTETDVIIAGKVGATTASTVLTIMAPTLDSLTLNPTSLVGGKTSTGTVTISSKAPTGGYVVSLTSSNPAAEVPSTVTISAGTTSKTFSVKTVAVAANLSAQITGTSGSQSVSASLSILAPTVVSVTLNPKSVVGGKSSTGTVKISSAAPKSGLVITLSSGNSDATVPSTVTISSGATSVSFTISTKKVTSTSTSLISGSVGSSSASATLTIT